MNTPTVVEVTSTPATTELDPSRPYLLLHLGVDTSGVANTEDVFAAINTTTVTADYSAESNKLICKSGYGTPLPPRTGSVTLATASGTVAVNILPLDRVPSVRID